MLEQIDAALNKMTKAELVEAFLADFIVFTKK